MYLDFLIIPCFYKCVHTEDLKFDGIVVVYLILVALVKRKLIILVYACILRSTIYYSGNASLLWCLSKKFLISGTESYLFHCLLVSLC